MRRILGKIRHTAVNMVIIALIALLNMLMLRTDNAAAVLTSGIYYRTDERNTVALECVLAWDGQYTEDILAILRENDVRITFVLCGNTALDNAGLVREIVRDGHSVLTLGMSYDDLSALNADELAKSIEKSVRILEGTGAYVSGFYANTSETEKAAKAAKKAGLPCIRSTIDLLSARGSADDIKERAKAARGGSIVAFTPTKAAEDALGGIIAMYSKAGLSVGKVAVND